MAHSVELRRIIKRFDDFVAVDDMNLSIADGEFFSLLGPSGCGKTTTLRMIAGFEQPTAGELFIMGQPVAGIPAHRRPVNTVFQNYALFPHMTVAQNVAFGLEMSRVPKADIARRVEEALARVHMATFATRRPSQLSGGQKQRVALARALVNRPKVLLLDEPLGALDLKLRKAMQLELKAIQQAVGITFVYVTHDQEEAMTMSDRLAVMDQGRIQQIGTPREVYEHPTNRFVADFIGETNFIEGHVVALEPSADKSAVAKVQVGDLELRGLAETAAPALDAHVTLAVRPEKINLLPDGVPAAAPGEVAVRGHVLSVNYIGTDTRYDVALASAPDAAPLVVRMQNYGARSEPRIVEGQTVGLTWLIENAQVLTA